MKPVLAVCAVLLLVGTFLISGCYSEPPGPKPEKVSPE